MRRSRGLSTQLLRKQKNMKVSELAAATKIASRIANQSALATIDNSIELSNDKIRCKSEFGNVELSIPETGISTPRLVNAQAITTLPNTLPPEVDIVFTEEENCIRWQAGTASAKLNFISTDHSIPKIKHDSFPWKPPAAFSEALIVASCACESAAVSIGLYGTTLLPKNGKLEIMSSNQIALAAASVDSTGYPAGQITLRPPIPKLIHLLINSCNEVSLDVTDKAIFIKGDWLTAQLPLGANLEHDLGKIAAMFQSAKQKVAVDNVSIKKFITRARALTDRKVSFTIGIRIENGQLIFEHRGTASEMEEYFMAAGLQKNLKYNSISLPADMLLEPLEFVSEAVLDYLPEQRIVLRGQNPDFIFVLGGD